MNSVLFVFIIGVSSVLAENCRTANDCHNEKCPQLYSVACQEHICSCEQTNPGECSSSDDCLQLRGTCENNDKHWYCNGHKCCCGEPCPHSGESFVCRNAAECAHEYFRCENNDKQWHCAGSHCHCGGIHGGIP